MSPVALSAISKLSPKRFTGQMMGLFTLTYSIGSLLAGLIAGKFNPENVQEMPLLFLQIGAYSIIAGLIIGFCSLLVRQWEFVQIEK